MNRNYLFIALLLCSISVTQATNLVKSSNTFLVREGNSIVSNTAENPLQFQFSKCAFARYNSFDKSSIEVFVGSIVHVNSRKGSVDFSTYNTSIDFSKIKLVM